MPATHPSRTLYRIDECPDLMADGCVGDEHGNLVFLSAWARDTAVQEFLARLTLGRDEQGLDKFHVITNEGASVPLIVGNVENLEKRITRAYRRTLFGSLTNVWLFDRRAVKPDKANASALALLPRESAHRAVGGGQCGERSFERGFIGGEVPVLHEITGEPREHECHGNLLGMSMEGSGHAHGHVRCGDFRPPLPAAGRR